MKALSIKHKILLLIMLISSTTMLLAGGSFVTYEWFNFRKQMVDDQSTLARMLAENSSAAVYFDDPEDAQEVLSSLQAMDEIEYAAIYHSDTSLFAEYLKDKKGFAELLVSTESEGFAFSSSTLQVWQPLILKGNSLQSQEELGTIYIQSNLTKLNILLLQSIIAISLSIFIFTVLAYLVASRLQSVISGPILHLAETAEQVTRNRDFSIRATKMKQDELGILTDTFNEMLSDIETGNAALHESEEQYRLLFESSSDAIFLMREDKFIDCNQRALDIFRCKREQIIGETPKRFSPEKQTDNKLSSVKAREKISAALAGKPQLFEWTHIHYDGTPFAAEVSLNSLFLVDKTYIQAIVRDISERKQAENNLSKSEEKYRTLFSSSNEGIALHETIYDDSGIPIDYRIVDVNPAYEKHTGIKKDRAMGSLASELYGTGDAPFLEKFTSGRAETFEVDFTPLNKSFNISFFPVGEGKFASLFSDITEQKQMQEEINRTNKKFMELIDMLPLIVFETDSKGRLVLYNQQAYEMLGYTKEDFSKGVSTLDFIAPEEKDRAMQNMQSIMAGNISIGNEYTLLKKDGFRFPAIVYSRAKKSGDDFVSLWGFIIDITERKNAEEEKEKLSAQLRQAQKLEAIGTLAGGIAHDFNNILTPLLLHTEMSMLNLPAGSNVRKHLEEVKVSAKRAANLVRQILEFSRKSELDIIPLQLNLICKEVIKFIRASIPTTIEIRQNLHDTSYVMADPDQMHQVLMNLCTNGLLAMKTEAKGLLEINLVKIKIGKEGLDFPPDLKPGNYLELSVRDSGCGMAAGIQQRIFEPFFSTRERGEGTGLGLSVVHGIIAAHNGAITIKSEPGQGSTFKVYLPVLEKKIKMRITKENESLPSGSEKILFVDDEISLLKACKEMLILLGYEVIDCINPHKVLEMFKYDPNSFDLLITDIAMPGMNGIDLVKEIFKTRPDIPVILISGHYTENQKAEVKALGIKNVISKPVSMSNMAVAIREALEKK